MPLWLWTIVILGGPAVALLALGRGRRVDDHPYCRRCRYDLVAGAPESAACPECGADLAARRAVRRGRRRRRRPALAGGAALLALALVGGAIVGWHEAHGFDFDRLKPTWLLLREARSGNASSANAALAELARRLSAGELTPAWAGGAVDAALAVQADPTATWHLGWGDLLDVADQMGVMDATQTAAYWSRVIDLDVFHRPRVRTGEPLPLAYRFVRRRCGSKASFTATVKLERVEVDGVEIDMRSAWGGATYGLSGWHVYDERYEVLADVDPTTGSGGLDPRLFVPARRPGNPKGYGFVDVAPGAGMLTTTWRLEIAGPAGAAATQTVLGTRRITRTEPIEVVAADVETVALVPPGGPELVTPPRVESPSAQALLDRRSTFVNGHLVFESWPYTTAFDVIWRSGDVEVLVAGGFVRRPRGKARVMYRSTLRDAGAIEDLAAMPGTIEIVLRPSRAAARMTTDIDAVVDEEIVIEDVEVIRTVDPSP